MIYFDPMVYDLNGGFHNSFFYLRRQTVVSNSAKRRCNLINATILSTIFLSSHRHNYPALNSARGKSISKSLNYLDGVDFLSRYMLR